METSGTTALSRRGVRTPKRAALVIRISKDRDGTSESPETQRGVLERLRESRGWEIGHEYVVRDVSASSKRWALELSGLCSLIERGECDGILAVDLDRLVRQVRDISALIEVCEPRRVPIVLASGELDTSTADGILKAHILAAVAENEGRKKSERQKRGNERAAREGKPHIGGRRAYGYDADRVTIRTDEAKVIRELAKRYIAGEPMNALATDLNARGIKPSASKEWTVTTLRSLLSSPRLAGLRTYQGEVVGPGNWKPIITMEQHAALIERIGSSAKRARPGRPETSLLSGVLRCALCGTGLVSGSSRDTRRYVCVAGNGRAGCGRMSIGAEKTEDFVTEMVLTALDDSEVPQLRASGQRERERELADIIERESQLSGMYASGDLGQHEWMTARKVLEQRKRALGTTDTDRKPPAVLYGRKSVRRAWPTMSQAERREVVTWLVEAIDVSPSISAPGGRAGRWDSSRLGEPVWRM
jgi:site-specific DNA recombinase